VPIDVTELTFTIASIGKLGARRIAEDEVSEILWNRYSTAQNHRTPVPGRRLLVGLTNGGRCLTIVIEPTDDPTTWTVITGWESTDRERKILES
jgi:hypothetical protein